MEILVSQGGSSSARSFDLARPGGAPPLSASEFPVVIVYDELSIKPRLSDVKQRTVVKQRQFTKAQLEETFNVCSGRHHVVCGVP